MDAVDHAETNFNQLRGVDALRRELSLNVQARDIDLDRRFVLPRRDYGLVLFLGPLYHLKNPFYVLEAIAARADWCVLSTRIAQVTPDHRTRIEDEPVAYLLGAREANNDPTNFWIFSRPAAGWDGRRARACHREKPHAAAGTSLVCSRVGTLPKSMRSAGPRSSLRALRKCSKFGCCGRNGFEWASPRWHPDDAIHHPASRACASLLPRQAEPVCDGRPAVRLYANVLFGLIASHHEFAELLRALTKQGFLALHDPEEAAVRSGVRAIRRRGELIGREDSGVGDGRVILLKSCRDCSDDLRGTHCRVRARGAHGQPQQNDPCARRDHEFSTASTV